MSGVAPPHLDGSHHDDESLRVLAQRQLRLRGIDVVTAAHGQDALCVLEHSPTLPLLILLDLDMPVMDGATFVACKADRSAWRNVPVVVTLQVGNDGVIDGHSGLVYRTSGTRISDRRRGARSRLGGRCRVGAPSCVTVVATDSATAARIDDDRMRPRSVPPEAAIEPPDPTSVPDPISSDGTS